MYKNDLIPIRLYISDILSESVHSMSGYLCSKLDLNTFPFYHLTNVAKYENFCFGGIVLFCKKFSNCKKPDIFYLLGLTYI